MQNQLIKQYYSSDYGSTCQSISHNRSNSNPSRNRSKNNKIQKSNSKQKIIYRQRQNNMEIRNRLLGNMPALINQRVERIKNKYGVHIDFRKNFMQYQHMSIADKQNENKQNCSIIANHLHKNNRAQSKNNIINMHTNPSTNNNTNPNTNTNTNSNTNRNAKNPKKQTKQSQKIQQLQQINQKITKLIQNLKQQQQIKQHTNIDEVTYRQVSILPLSNHTNHTHHTNSIKSSSVTHSNISQKKSRIKTQSITNQQLYNSYISNKQHQTNRSLRKSYRQNGKLQKIKNDKTLKQLNNSVIIQNQNKKLQKYILKQLQYDQQYIKNKTKLLKLGKNYHQLLITAIQNTNLTKQQKQIFLQCNFDDIDPLFTERNQKIDKIDQNLLVYQTVDSYLKCQNYWRRKINQNFNKNLLNLCDLDQEGKGYFLKQDFTRFASLLTKKMYCNRDIILIYKRINPKKTKIVPMELLIKALCF